jgi:hypothetical protein
MQAVIRRKLSMAGKALAFERAHPSTDASHQAVVARLEEVVTRVDAVFTQERLGTVGARAAAARRKTVRRTLRMRIRHLARVGAIAAAEDPLLTGKFIPPSYSGPNRIFLGTAKALLLEATTHQEALLASGLGESFLADFTAAITAFEAAAEEIATGRREHVAARVDFDELGKECIAMVQILDGLNAARFAKEPELLAAWKSARNVFGPFTRSRDDEPEEGVIGLLPPGAPGGELKAA